MSVRIGVIRLSHAEGLPLPAYATDQAAGMDLIAAIGEAASITLKPRQSALIPTGLVVELPSGFEAQVRPRSGLALKHGITVLNAPGTVDADYRGEVQVLLINHGTEPFTVVRGMRIAQMVVAPVVQAALVERITVTDTRRGGGGFGSTGH
jgi:dUTP pyrophosphatase